MLPTRQYNTHAEQLLRGEPSVLRALHPPPPGVVHAVSPVGGRVLAVLGHSCFVTTIHDVMPFHFWRAHPARYTFLRWCITLSARRSVRIIVTFQFNKNYLVEHLGVPEHKIDVVPIGVDPQTLGVDGSTATAREDDIPRLLFLGSWNPFERGGDLVLRSMPDIIREVPRARLIFSCASRSIPAMRELARSLHIELAVDFPGFIPEGSLGSVLRGADVFVYPSRIGFSASVLQAMHVGTPVVAGDCLDMPEFVSDSGVISPMEDPSKMARLIIGLLHDRDQRRRLAEKGKRRVGDFSIDQMIGRTLEVYHQVMSK
ncbi:MAG: glycosyltransferase family 4 protein [Euryarchaeota archaeon]|nr:glycosyltransferase family 4 protein [Euryarchaeota archaeon]MDE1837264.1 glycosyltransferase family 4 protein [Euryarchaeota archaeon]MDE1879934.1 glycosyltransferase family 4 protein [Euryarchaeota archaeon]MDE2045132.1 glycosyltransferase family 4 protein [Thermoplasmata archaeon]